MLIIIGILLLQHAQVQGQLHEDRRCRCQCPGGVYLINSTLVTLPAIYTKNVMASQCNCEEIVLPVVGDTLNEHKFAFCSHCKCTIQTRNTMLIMGTVICIVVLISWLVAFSIFMHCLYAVYTRRLMPKDNREDEQDENLGDDLPLFRQEANDIPLQDFRVIMNPLVRFVELRNSQAAGPSPPSSAPTPAPPSPEPSTSAGPLPRGGDHNMRLRQIPRINYRKYL